MHGFFILISGFLEEEESRFKVFNGFSQKASSRIVIFCLFFVLKLSISWAQLPTIDLHLDFNENENYVLARAELQNWKNFPDFNTYELQIKQVLYYQQNLLILSSMGSHKVKRPDRCTRVIVEYEFSLTETASLYGGLWQGQIGKEIPIPFKLEEFETILSLEVQDYRLPIWSSLKQLEVRRSRGRKAHFFASTTTSESNLVLKLESQLSENLLIAGQNVKSPQVDGSRTKRMQEFENLISGKGFSEVDCDNNQIGANFLLGKAGDESFEKIRNDYLHGKIGFERLKEDLLQWRLLETGSRAMALKRFFLDEYDESSELGFLLEGRRYFKIEGYSRADSLRRKEQAFEFLLASAPKAIRKELVCKMLSLETDSALLGHFPKKVRSIWLSFFKGARAPSVEISYTHNRQTGRVQVVVQQNQGSVLSLETELLLITDEGELTLKLKSQKAFEAFIQEPINSNIEVLIIDPLRELPIKWTFKKSDAQLLAQLNKAENDISRYEAIEELLQTKNVSLKSTVVGIGADDRWSEIRLLALSSCSTLNEFGRQKLMETFENLANLDVDDRVKNAAKACITGESN